MPEFQQSRSGRPLPGEYAVYAQADLDRVEGDDAAEVLGRQREATVALYSALDEREIRGLAFPIAGHELHHHRILAEKYLGLLRR
jgi:hypothetical protein